MGLTITSIKDKEMDIFQQTKIQKSQSPSKHYNHTLRGTILMTETKGSNKLYEISGKLEDLNNLLEQLEDAIIPDELTEVYQELLAEIDKTKADFYDKIDNILALIQSRKKWMQIRKEESDRLNKLIKQDENTIKFLNEYLLRHLQAQEIPKLRTKRFNLTVANNGGKLPVWIDSKLDPQELPKKYQSVTIEVNKKAIREALEAGEKLEFAGFSERGKHLRIK